MPIRGVLFLASLALLAAAPPPPAVPAYRQFGRWLVACDNTRRCIARGFDDATRAQLDIARSAGPSRTRLAFSAEDPIDRASIRIDGQILAVPAPVWSASEGTLSTDDPRAVQAFIAAARDGHLITLGTAPDKDDRARTIPLDGMTAALLLMDAVQGRPGTPAPLVAATGQANAPPAPSLPAAPVWIRPPRLTPAETRRLRSEASRLHSPNFDPCTVSDPPNVYALDAISALAIRPCYLAAYQGSSVVAVLPRAGGAGVPVTLVLPGLPDHATSGPDMVDPAFMPASGTLFTSGKGRGLADCGSSASWVWSRGAFRMKTLEYQNQCGGAAPGDWPTLFRTR